MPTYEFSVVLKTPTALTEDLADKLFAAGCDDATPNISRGVVSIDFHRTAEDYLSALQSAVANIRDSGCVVDRVELAKE